MTNSRIPAILAMVLTVIGAASLVAMIVQSLVPGPGNILFYAALIMTVIAFVEQLRLRDQPPTKRLVWMLIIAGLLPVVQTLIVPGSALAFLTYLLLTGAGFLLRFLQAKAEIEARAARR